MKSRLKNGIVRTRGNEGACPLVYSRTGSWLILRIARLRIIRLRLRLRPLRNPCAFPPDLFLLLNLNLNLASSLASLLNLNLNLFKISIDE
jgi:hypothetical protein